MKIIALTAVRFLKVATLFLCMVSAPSSPAYAQAIKMLPPTNCPNVPTGQPNVWGVLGWDSKNPLSCIPNFNFGDNSYVGIGSATIQPLALLDLYGSGNYPYPTPGTGTVGTNLGNLHMQPVDNVDFNSTAITFGANMAASPSNGYYDGVAEAGIYVQYSHNTAYPAPGTGAGTRMLFGTTNNYATGAQIRMTIDNNGNVGIGTIAPPTRLTTLDSTGLNSPTVGTASGGFTVLNSDNILALEIGVGTGGSASGTDWIQATRIDGNTTPGSLVLNPSGGNVGIGTPSPAAKLNVYGGAFNLSTDTTGGSLIATEYSGLTRITSGAVGGGGTIAIGREPVTVHGQAAGTYTVELWSGSNGGSSPTVEVSGGNVGIETMNPAYTLEVNGSLGIDGPIYSTGIQGRNGLNGPFTGHAFNWVWTSSCIDEFVDVTPFVIMCASDQRLKTAIQPLGEPQGLAAIEQLKPVSFDWKNPGGLKGKQFGFLAQDVRTVLPNLVRNTGLKSQDTPDGMLHLDYNGLIAPMVKAIQELKASFDGDHETVMKLKSDNDKLKAANDDEAAQIMALGARLNALETARR